MSGEREGGCGEPAAATARQPQTRSLALALREAASRAAEEVGGGLALVFATANGTYPLRDAPRLRAAAGFAAAEAARDAAGTLVPQVRQVLEGRSAQRFGSLPSLGDRASGGLVILPLLFEEQVHGALVVCCPAPLEPAQDRAIEDLAAMLSLRLDHVQLTENLARIGSKLEEKPESPGEQSEEVLKLSEALFAQDIELLRTNEKLSKIEKLKNDFIEKMSRELRTPLNSIIEAIISVLTGENDALSENAKTSLRSALDDGTAFLRTLQNILDLWRIKQGELPLEIQEVNFREVVDEAIFSVQDAVGEKPLELEPKLEHPFPKIRTDLTKVNQILFLLLDNAAKFTHRGRIEIAARVANGRLTCEVRDTGIGICPDDQQFVFDEFYQVDESSSQTYNGAGLGLALVRDLIVLLEGEVSIASEVGRGTAVSFEIPVQVVG